MTSPLGQELTFPYSASIAAELTVRLPSASIEFLPNGRAQQFEQLDAVR